MATLSDWLRDVDFVSLLTDLENYGWFHVVFPFLLVYAVIFTILNQVKVLEEKKPVKAIVSIVIGLFAVAFPISNGTNCGFIGYSPGSVSGYCTLGDLMIALFPGVTAITMGILALYIVAAMLGVDLVSFFGDNNKDNAIVKYVLGGLGFLAVAYYFARGFGWEGFDSTGWTDFFEDPLLYVVILFALFFWYISQDDVSPAERFKRWEEKNPDASAEERARKRKLIIGD